MDQRTYNAFAGRFWMICKHVGVPAARIPQEMMTFHLEMLQLANPIEKVAGGGVIAYREAA